MENVLNIPTSWDKVSLGIGQKIFSLETQTGLTSDEYFVHVAEYFGYDPETLSVEERKELKTKLFKLLATKPPTTYNNEFIIGGKRYLLEKDLSKMSWALFRDKNILLERNENNFWLTAHLIMAALIRPSKEIKSKNILSKKKFEIEKYDFDGLEERAELYSKVLTVSDIYGISLFFYLIAIQFLKHTITSSLVKAQAIQMNEPKSLEKYGVGKNTPLT